MIQSFSLSEIRKKPSRRGFWKNVSVWPEKFVKKAGIVIRNLKTEGGEEKMEILQNKNGRMLKLSPNAFIFIETCGKKHELYKAERNKPLQVLATSFLGRKDGFFKFQSIADPICWFCENRFKLFRSDVCLVDSETDLQFCGSFVHGESFGRNREKDSQLKRTKKAKRIFENRKNGDCSFCKHLRKVELSDTSGPGADEVLNYVTFCIEGRKEETGNACESFELTDDPQDRTDYQEEIGRISARDLLWWSSQPGVRSLTIWDYFMYEAWGFKGLLWIFAGIILPIVAFYQKKSHDVVNSSSKTPGEAIVTETV